MIRRETDDRRLLISQIEHARLSYHLARAWGNEQTPGLPLAEWLLPAVEGHDDGWFEWEQSPDENDQGVPRSFTEMPAQESVAIWVRGIEACASGPPSYSEALRRLRGDDGGEPSWDKALVLEELLRGRRRFHPATFIAGLGHHRELTEDIATSALARFERAGIVRPAGRILGRDFLEIVPEPVGENPLAGLWVSGHFQSLARQSKEHRADKNEDAILDRFIDEQERRRDAWRKAASEFAGAELERVIDTGLRYLQLFDRMSLWLCMAERDEPWEARLSRQQVFAFRPETNRIIQVTPWPFSAGALELEVTAYDGKHNTILPWRMIPGKKSEE